MPRITAWKSTETGTIFEHESDYRAHLDGLAKIKETEARHRDALVKADEALASLYLCRSHGEIAAWLIENSDAFIEAQIARGHFREWRGPRRKKLRFTEVTFEQIRWEGDLSNSHSNPMGRVSNWGGCLPEAPRSYPGWSSRIRFRLNREIDTFSSDLFRGTGIHPGTGGSGDYDCKLFADDFPAMRAWENRANPRLRQRKNGAVIVDERTVAISEIISSPSSRDGIMVRRGDLFIPIEKSDRPLPSTIDQWLRDHVGWDDNHETDHDRFIYDRGPTGPAVPIGDLPGPRRRYSYDAERQTIFFHDIRDARKFRAVFGNLINNARLINYRHGDETARAFLLSHQDVAYHSVCSIWGETDLGHDRTGHWNLFRDEQERLMFQIVRPEAVFFYAADLDIAQRGTGV
jgi:hypothetical protein